MIKIGTHEWSYSCCRYV